MDPKQKCIQSKPQNGVDTAEVELVLVQYKLLETPEAAVGSKKPRRSRTTSSTKDQRLGTLPRNGPMKSPNSHMTKPESSNTGNKRHILKRRSCLKAEYSTEAVDAQLAPRKKGKRVVKKTAATQLEVTHTFKKDTPPESSYEPACLRCKQLEAEVERLQNELNKLRDIKEEPVLPVSAAELLIEKVKTLESKVSSLETPKMSALCAMEMEFGDIFNNGIEIEIKDDKINLGQNFFCSLASWKVMNRTDRMPEWYVAILRGTFGEDAKNHRVNPRSEKNKAFDPFFLEVAEGHFCRFLDRRISELTENNDEFSLHLLDFFKSNRDKLIKQLPASLSDRAYDMSRGKLQAQKSKLRGDKNAETSRRIHSEPNRRQLRKMLTQPKPKKGLEALFHTSLSTEGSEEEDLE